MSDELTMIELFSGIGAQERALRQLHIPYEIINTCDCDKDAVLSYAATRFNLEKEMENFDFPPKEQMIEELQAKNVGYDFQKSKHSIASRTNENKIKQYYIADKLTKNLGDISKVKKLPYADILTYSSPCQSFSVAGKLAGAAKTCVVCGHKWDIDFSNPEYNYKCPVCGNALLETTTSGLLAEVQRLLSISYKENILPKYLVLENVKNLVGKQFKPQFDAWVKWLDSIGYNTYYKVLNAKNFGIPQNRERIFAISIRKDIDDGTFQFPSEIPLTTRLKDILETNVDEKYYLSNDKIEKIFLDFIERQTNEPSIIKVAQLESSFDQSGRVYSTEGIAPTIMSNSHGKTSGGYIAPKIVEPFIVASRGRNPDNPSDRTTGAPTEQRLEPNLNGTTNTITTVQKDNYVLEPVVVDDMYNNRPARIYDKTAPTLRSERTGLKVIESEVDTIKVRNQATEFAGFTDTAGTLLARDYKGFENQEMTAVIERCKNIQYRIRKLTPKECWRLMGFTDEDFNKVSKYVSASALYKQAGNSIVTSCLIAIFYSLLFKDNNNAYTKYLINFNSHS